jgi:hypothetical protein
MGKIEKRFEAIEKRIDKLEFNEGLSETVGWTEIGDLEWSDDLGELTWEDAKKKCEELGGRLPTRTELVDLYDNHYDECQELIEDSPSYTFWSATESSSTAAWAVYLNSGVTGSNVKTFAYQLRCVRERVI